MEKLATAVAFTCSLLVTSSLTLGSYIAIYMLRHYVPVQDAQKNEQHKEAIFVLKSKAA